MNVLATLKATRILRTAQEGGFFDDLLVVGTPILEAQAAVAERAKALLAGEWDADVEVKIREYMDKRVGMRRYRLHFTLR